MRKVVETVRTTLTDLKLAVDGTIIMSEGLRDALDSMYDARVPLVWQRVSTTAPVRVPLRGCETPPPLGATQRVRDTAPVGCHSEGERHTPVRVPLRG